MSSHVVTSQQIVWDQAVLDKYNYSGPRYTSYPTAVEFHEAFTIADYDRACAQYPDRTLSLYVHIPFCHKLCFLPRSLYLFLHVPMLPTSLSLSFFYILMLPTFPSLSLSPQVLHIYLFSIFIIFSLLSFSCLFSSSS